MRRSGASCWRVRRGRGSRPRSNCAATAVATLSPARRAPTCCAVSAATTACSGAAVATGCSAAAAVTASYGGKGNDVLRGGPTATGSSAAAARDLLRGRDGADTIRARDGRRDRIACGPGRDRATLDAARRHRRRTGASPQGRCEVVHRLLGRNRTPSWSRPGTSRAAQRRRGDHRGAGRRACPGTIAALGDTVYESGTPAEYANCYEPTWGRHKARTRPAVGNHEYGTPGASGYFGYFGAAAGRARAGLVLLRRSAPGTWWR